MLDTSLTNILEEGKKIVSTSCSVNGLSCVTSCDSQTELNAGLDFTTLVEKLSL
jgi:hypothetical protein